MFRRLPAAFLLLPVCGVLFWYGLGAGALYRTEGLRAFVASEMLRRGDWIVPTCCGEPLLTKPPLGYVAVVLASLPFGAVHPWTARLPSALAATLTVLLFHALFRRVLGGGAGWVAALLLPMSLLWLAAAPSADLDILEVAWVAGAIVCLFRAVEAEPESGRHAVYLWWLAALVCVAGGVLTKWTAPAFFYLTAVPFLWRCGRLRLLLRPPHLVAVAVAGLICLGWAALVVGQVGCAELRDTVAQEAISKLVPGHRSRPYPWDEAPLHPLHVFLAALPSSAVALLTLRPGFVRLWNERERRLLLLLHCWTWPSLLFWSLVPVHAVRHSFPLAPGLAGLSAFVWIAWLRGRLHWPLPVAPRTVLGGLLGLWLVVKIGYVQLALPARDGKRGPEAKGALVAAVVPPGETLYLFRLKDETLLYYVGRPARRLDDADAWSSATEPSYGLLTEEEWRQWPRPEAVEVVTRLTDVQSAPLVLVRVRAAAR